jgi:hypothetical protein
MSDDDPGVVSRSFATLALLRGGLLGKHMGDAVLRSVWLSGTTLPPEVDVAADADGFDDNDDGGGEGGEEGVRGEGEREGKGEGEGEGERYSTAGAGAGGSGGGGGGGGRGAGALMVGGTGLNDSSAVAEGVDAHREGAPDAGGSAEGTLALREFLVIPEPWTRALEAQTPTPEIRNLDPESRKPKSEPLTLNP